MRLVAVGRRLNQNRKYHAKFVLPVNRPWRSNLIKDEPYGPGRENLTLDHPPVVPYETMLTLSCWDRPPVQLEVLKINSSSNFLIFDQ